MSARAGKLRVGAVADLHAHRTHQGEFRQLFAELGERVDVVALSGDLTNLGLPEEAESLAQDLSVLRVPVVAVLGNHDHHSGRVDEVKGVLAKANVTFLEDETFEAGGVGFAGTKGFGGGFGAHLLASFGEEATRRFVGEAVNEALALENSLRSLSTSRRVAVLHYSPVAETVKGEPAEIWPYLGCSRLAETIDRFDVGAVFHGHAHHGARRGKTPKGIAVHNCSLPMLRRAGGDPYIVVEV